MAAIVPLRYRTVFGKCDSSDWFEWEVALTPTEEKAYIHALQHKIPFKDVPELVGALELAREEIEKKEIEDLIRFEDEFTLECMGRELMDPDVINELIESRDAHTIAFFGLNDLSDEELDDWDANDLDSLPNVCDFDASFKATSPFEEGWILEVEFAKQ